MQEAQYSQNLFENKSMNVFPRKNIYKNFMESFINYIFFIIFIYMQ